MTPPVRTDSRIAARLIAAARQLSTAVDTLSFSDPVAHVYNPLSYAWAAHEAYLRRFGRGTKRIAFVGMNPGPFGMVQTGVPFGEVAAVRDWLGLQAPVLCPARQHPRRPVTGFSCTRSEVSGRRLWGLFASRFRLPECFFAEHIVFNYCPLAFIERSGRNRTPDKLAIAERAALFALCDEHLRSAIAAVEPEWVIGIGEFAFQQASELFADAVKLGRVLHPSPACPAANRDWAGAVTRQLKAMGAW